MNIVLNFGIETLTQAIAEIHGSSRASVNTGVPLSICIVSGTTWTERGRVQYTCTMHYALSKCVKTSKYPCTASTDNIFTGQKDTYYCSIIMGLHASAHFVQYVSDHSTLAWRMSRPTKHLDPSMLE